MKEGKIEVWTSVKTGELKEIRFSLDGYLVSVRITGINKPSPYANPETFLSFGEWKNKQFSLSLPKEPIEEVLVGSYGDLSKEYSEAVRKAIQKETGVKTTFLGSVSLLDKKSNIYNSKRRQFDANEVLKNAEIVSAKYGEKKRSIYLFDVDMYSSLFPDRRSVWYAERYKGNVSIISLYDLKKRTDASAEQADPLLVISRLQKISLHTLGASLGFDFSPSSYDKKCLMFPAATLQELDGEGSGYCSPEKDVVKGLFKK